MSESNVILQPITKKDKTLIVFPFLGEFGHECFCWNGVVRKVARDFKETIVFGSPGKSDLYADFASYAQIDVPKHESECLIWKHFDKYRHEFDSIRKGVLDHCLADLKLEKEMLSSFWLENLPQSPISSAFYDLQEHHKIVPTGSSFLPTAGISDQAITDKVVTLCVRDRGLSTFRNWEAENWIDLTRRLEGLGYCPVLIGSVGQEMQEALSCLNYSLLNKTSINDCISILSESALAVGGSTGTMHLASLCGTNHLVWGADKNVIRYRETNWFNAKHKVVVSGWNPKASLILDEVKFFMEQDRFFGEQV